MSVVDNYLKSLGVGSNAPQTAAPQPGVPQNDASRRADQMQRRAAIETSGASVVDSYLQNAGVSKAPVSMDLQTVPAAAPARSQAIPTGTNQQQTEAAPNRAGATPSSPMNDSYMGSSLQRGWNTLKAAFVGQKLSTAGEMLDAFNRMPQEELAKSPEKQKDKAEWEKIFADLSAEYSSIQNENEDILLSPATRPETRKMLGVDTPDQGWWDSAKRIGSAIIEDPRTIIDLGLSSAPATIAAVVSSIAAARSGPVGAAAAGGAASGYVEFGNEYADNRAQGMSHDEAWKKAALKSGVVGALDAVSMKTAGNALESVIDAAAAGGGTRAALSMTAKETGRQAALGAAGEAGGSIAAGEEVDPTSVMLEAVGETVTAPAEAVSNRVDLFRNTPESRAKRALDAGLNQFESLSPGIARRQAIDALSPAGSDRPAVSGSEAGVDGTAVGTAVSQLAGAKNAPDEDQPTGGSEQQAQILSSTPAAATAQNSSQVDPLDAALGASEQQFVSEVAEQQAAQATAVAQPASTLTTALDAIKTELGIDAAETLNVTEVTDDTRLNRLGKALETAFGVKVHWVDFGEQLTTASGKQLGAFDGFRHRDTILLTRGKDFIDTTWHELTHVLETRHPDVYRALRDKVVPSMDPAERQKLVNDLNAARQREVGRDLTATELDSELVAYTVGRLAQNPDTLLQMFDSFNDPGLARQFRDVLTDILDKLLSVVKGPQYITERKQLVASQKAVVNAFAEFQKRETQKRMAAPPAAPADPQAQGGVRTAAPAATPIRTTPAAPQPPKAAPVAPDATASQTPPAARQEAPAPAPAPAASAAPAAQSAAPAAQVSPTTRSAAAAPPPIRFPDITNEADQTAERDGGVQAARKRKKTEPEPAAETAPERTAEQAEPETPPAPPEAAPSAAPEQQDAGQKLNPLLPIVDKKEAEDRVSRRLKRKEGVGAPTNERRVIRSPGLPDFVVGKVTTRDWLNRVTSLMSTAEMQDARVWYRQLDEAFRPLFGEETPKFALAWLLSQKRASPTKGFMDVLRAADMASGNPEIKKAGLNQQALVDVLSGRVPEGGIGAKLLDFLDSELGRNTRTVVRDDPRGRQPAAIDVWAQRDIGFIDETVFEYLRKNYGEEAVAGLQVDKTTSGEAQYEYGIDFYNDVVEMLNEQGYDGGAWTAREVQAVGWVAMQRQMGVQAEFVRDIIGGNTRRISIGLAPGANSVLSNKLAGKEIPVEVAQREVSYLAELAGVRVKQNVAGVGAYLQWIEGAIQIDAVGSPESVADFMDMVGYAFQQTEIINTRPLKSARNMAVDVMSPGLDTVDRATAFFSKFLETGPRDNQGEPVAPGFQQITIDGVPGIRLLNFGGKWRQTQLAEMLTALNGAADSLGIELADIATTNVELNSTKNDWSEKPDGKDYIDSLKGRGRVRQAELLQRRYPPSRVDVAGDGAISWQREDGGSFKRRVGPDVRSLESAVRPREGGGVTLSRARQPDAQSYVGVHFGNVPGLAKLSGAKSGTGIKGEEATRLNSKYVDPRIKKRVYFYINYEGLGQASDGKLPRPEVGLGNNLYTQQFDNILPPGPKTWDLWEVASKRAKRGGNADNHFESAVIDAGYDGYAVPKLGMMVILNHDAPVNYVGRVEGSGKDAKIKRPKGGSFARRFEVNDDAEVAQAGPGLQPAKDAAAEAVDALGRTPSDVALAISEDFRLRQRTTLVGKRAPTPEDLAVLAQVYRDPRFETLRYFFLNGRDEIIGQVGVSSRMPAASVIHIGDDPKEFLDTLVERANELGATRVYVLHNHPSGNPNPSEADLRVTAAMGDYFSKKGIAFMGHVVIDTNAYSVIKENGNADTFTADLGQKPFEPVGTGAIMGYTSTGFTGNSFRYRLSGPDDLAMFASSLSFDQDSVVILSADAGYSIQNLVEVPNDQVMSYGMTAADKIRALTALRRITLSGRSTSLFAVGRNLDVLKRLSGVVTDYVHIDDTGGTSTGSGSVGDLRMALTPERRGRVSPDTSPEFEYLRDAVWARSGARFLRNNPVGGVAEETDERFKTVTADLSLPVDAIRERANATQRTARPAAPPKPVAYNIVNSRTGEVVGKATSLKGARAAVDRRDNAYGAYVHRIQIVDPAADLEQRKKLRSELGLPPPTGERTGNAFARRRPAVGGRFVLPSRSFRERYIENAFENRFSRAEDVQQAVVAQGGTLDIRDAQGNVVGNTDISSAAARMRGAVRGRLDRFKKEVQQPLIEEAAKLGVNLDEVAQYLYATYAPERNAIIQQRNPTQFPVDGGSGMTNAEALQIVSTFRARPDFQNIERIADGMKRITRMTQQLLLSEGLVEPQVIAQWQRDNPNYVPLRGFEDFDEETGNSVGNSRLDPRNPFVKTAKGRTSRAGMIVENILKDYTDAVVLAEKNKVYRLLLQFVRSNPDPTLWQVNAPTVSRSYYKAGMTPLGYAQGTVRIAYDVNENPNETIAVRVQGKTAFIQINDAGMLEDLQMQSTLGSGEQAQLFYSVWGGAMQTLAKLRTTLSPAFVAIDAIRNVETGGVWNIVKYGPRTAGRAYARLFKAGRVAWNMERDPNWTGGQDIVTVNIPGQPRQTMTMAQLYDMYRADGGKVGYLDIKDVEDVQREIMQNYRIAMAAGSLDPRTYHLKMLGALNGAEELMMDAAGSIETSMRFATYVARLEGGATRQEATDAAKNVTVNFDRKGKYTPQLGMLYMFANASIQGTRGIYNLIFKSGKAGYIAGASLIGLGYAVAQTAAMVGGDDDEPYWDKQLYKQSKLKSLLFFTPDGNTVTIPMAYGLGFFVNLGYALADLQRGVPLAKVGAFVRDSFFTHFSPFGTLENPATFAAPTMLDPLLVTTMNMTEMGIPLMPDSTYEPGTPDSEKFWAASRGTMFQEFTRYMNEATGGTQGYPGAIDVSPESLRYWTSWLTGGTGGFARDIAETIYLTSAIGLDSAVEKNKIPILRSFHQKNTGKQNQVEFYRNSEEALARLNEWKLLYGTEKIAEEETSQRINDQMFVSELGAAVDNYRKALNALRAEEVDIIDKRSAGFYDAAEAEQLLKDRAEQRNQLYIDFNREFYRALPDKPSEE